MCVGEEGEQALLPILYMSESNLNNQIFGRIQFS